MGASSARTELHLWLPTNYNCIYILSVSVSVSASVCSSSLSHLQVARSIWLDRQTMPRIFAFRWVFFFGKQKSAVTTAITATTTTTRATTIQCCGWLCWPKCNLGFKTEVQCGIALWLGTVRFGLSLFALLACPRQVWPAPLCCDSYFYCPVSEP